MFFNVRNAQYHLGKEVVYRGIELQFIKEYNIFNVIDAQNHSDKELIFRNIEKQSMNELKIFNVNNAQNHSFSMWPMLKIVSMLSILITYLL